MEVHVALDLLALFPEQQRQQVPGPEAASEPGAQAGVHGGAGSSDGVAVLGEELVPHLDVTLLDPGQLDVHVLPLRIELLAGQDEVEIGRIGFVLPVVQPGVKRCVVEGHERKIAATCRMAMG